MSTVLCNGSLLKCSFGAAPAPLIVTPQNKVNTTQLPTATIMDNKPMANIPSFGTCSSLSNPVVATATAAAMGSLTPMPCVPCTSAPWTPGIPQVTIANLAVATQDSKCMCDWGGMIEVTTVAQMTVDAN